MKIRISYAIAALALFGIEVCIALFARDDFVRPFVGDVLVVILIHCAVRILSPAKPRLLAVYVFAIKESKDKSMAFLLNFIVYYIVFTVLETWFIHRWLNTVPPTPEKTA